MSNEIIVCEQCGADMCTVCTVKEIAIQKVRHEKGIEPHGYELHCNYCGYTQYIEVIYENQRSDSLS